MAGKARVAGSVVAGFPSPAEQYLEPPLDLNALLVKRPAATYFVRVEGDSMINAGINPGDLLVVDRSLTPVDGDIIIASVDGEFTVKRLRIEVEKKGGGGQRIVKIPLSTSSLHLFSSADWLILALPSTTGTDDIVNAKLIAKLNKKCVVINVGRGNSVDEKALLKALRQGKIAGAYLDVCKHEPSGTGGDSPRKIGGVCPHGTVPFLGALPDLPGNLVIMPHSSAFSPQYLKICFKELQDDGCL